MVEFEHIVFVADELARQKVEREKQMFQVAAFNRWLTGNVKAKRFDEYLASLGLGEKPQKISKQEREEEIAKANSVADKIIAADRQRLKNARSV